MKYLSQLLEDAAALTAKEMLPENGPKNDPKPGDRPLGTVPEDVRRFYYLFTKVAKETGPRLMQIRHEAELLEAKDELAPEKKRALQNELNQLSSQRDLIEKLFWTGVKNSVSGGYGVENMALRKDWHIVEQASEPEPVNLLGSLVAASLLSRIIGGGCDDPNCRECHPQPSRQKQA